MQPVKTDSSPPHLSRWSPCGHSSFHGICQHLYSDIHGDLPRCHLYLRRCVQTHQFIGICLKCLGFTLCRKVEVIVFYTAAEPYRILLIQTINKIADDLSAFIGLLLIDQMIPRQTDQLTVAELF